jgi:di/tripeptidase
MVPTLGSVDKAKLEGVLKELSNSFGRIEAEREWQREITKQTCEDLGLEKKVFGKLSKTYHKRNFAEETQLYDDFESLYKAVTTT